jgi:hypothetical protein
MCTLVTRMQLAPQTDDQIGLVPPELCSVVYPYNLPKANEAKLTKLPITNCHYDLLTQPSRHQDEDVNTTKRYLPEKDPKKYQTRPRINPETRLLRQQYLQLCSFSLPARQQ